MSNSIIRIRNYVKEKDIKTITLDIFDTVLMRKIHPEDEQFYIVAEKWLDIFHENINADITAEKIYYWRVYIRNELFDINNKYVLDNTALLNRDYYDVTLKSWFENLVTTMAAQYNVVLSERKVSQIVEKMIEIELDTEAENLYPNKELVACINEIKTSRPDIKVYFVSDMYLTTKQVKGLLAAHNVDCFDGGITSTDARCVKHDASIFYRLTHFEPFGKSFDIITNLHIGDSRTSDYLMPIKAGSRAIWLKENAKRVQRENRIGEKAINKLKKCCTKKELVSLKQELRVKDKNENDIWIRYGELFSQPLISFLTHVAIAVKNAPDTAFLLVSSEAKFFKEITDHEFAQSLSGNNVIVADKLNRKTMMRALIWQLSHTDNLKRNLRPIIETVHYGETNGSRIETYKFIFGDKYPCSELTLNLRNDKEFLGSLYDEIESLKPEDSKELFAAYSYVNSLASKIDTRTIIVDVGWGGTVQTLFAEFCQNIDGSRDISGLYLGAHPADRFPIQDTLLDGYLMKNVRDGKDREIWNAVVWEYAYTNKIQFDSDELHLRLIQCGIQKGIEFFRNTTLSPYDYFFHVSRRKIRRLLQNPSRQEVKALGNIEFDCGFIKKSSFNIVNMNYSQKAFYKMLIRNPRHTILDVIYATNNWPAGYIKYYHLFGLRTALRIYGKIRKKRYI